MIATHETRVSRGALPTLVGLIVALWGSPAFPCSCLRIGPPCEAAWLQADAVFVGRVYWSWLLPTKVAGLDSLHRRVRIHIVEPFIGDVSGWVTIETGAGGGDCGFNFGWGEKYLIYAHREKDGSLHTSICTRTQKVSNAGVDLAYLRSIKSLPPTGRVYGTAKQYTFDPSFKPGEVSIMSPYGGPEERLFSMRPLFGTVIHLTRGSGVTAQAVRTKQSGDFTFEGIPPGHYKISVDLPERMQPWGEHDITVPAKGCFEVSIRTAFNGRLAGRVTDKSGNPIPYVAVEVVRAMEAGQAERSFRWENADKNGVFEIGPLPPDIYVIGVNIVKYSGTRDKPRTYYPGTSDLSGAKRIRVDEGQLVEGLNFQLEAPVQPPPSH